MRCKSIHLYVHTTFMQVVRYMLYRYQMPGEEQPTEVQRRGMHTLLLPANVELRAEYAQAVARPLPSYLAVMPAVDLERLPQFLQDLFVGENPLFSEVRKSRSMHASV